MLKAIAIGAGVVVGAIMVLAALRPDTFQVRRSATIKAKPEQIYPLINDLHRFNTWNPFDKKDPNIKGSYSGPESGKGAAYAFEGNKNVGKGTIEILDSAPASKVTMALRMLEPFRVDNRVVFTLAPDGAATAKIIHLFVNM